MKKKKIITCINCGKEFTEEQIDKTREYWKENPLCKLCSEKLYIAFNGE